MKAANFFPAQYCRRIVCEDEPKANPLQLMRRQLSTILFENLDVQAEKVVSPAPGEIVEKIIDCNRGDFRHEVNGLFSMALEALGIEYQFVAARPMFYPFKRPIGHVAMPAER